MKEIKENMRNLVREISDTLSGVDSNPEHIAGFPHGAGCSRTMPLTLNTELKIRLGAAVWNTTAERIVIGKTCQECKGIISFR